MGLKLFDLLGSRRWMLSSLFLTFVGSVTLAVLYTLEWNPEIRFWKAAANKKVEWIGELRESSQRPIAICFGGSSIGFGIDAGYATDELGFPMANMGLHAGMGVNALTGFALSEIRPGDTLMVMIEPNVLTSDKIQPALGTQFCHAMENPGMKQWRADDDRSLLFLKDLPSLRPGASNLFSMAGKLVLGKPLYRYQAEDMQPGGMLVTGVRGNIQGRKGVPDSLSPYGKVFFQELKEVAESKDFKVIYALPWVYSEGAYRSGVRESRERFLKDVELLVPVLWEQGLGVRGDRDDFADTPQHLTAEAARLRTVELVRAFRSQFEK